MPWKMITGTIRLRHVLQLAEVFYLNLTDPRIFLTGMLFAVYVGLRGTLRHATHS